MGYVYKLRLANLSLNMQKQRTINLANSIKESLVVGFTTITMVNIMFTNNLTRIHSRYLQIDVIMVSSIVTTKQVEIKG